MSKEADLYNYHGKSLINYNGVDPASKEKDPIRDVMEFKSLEELNFELIRLDQLNHYKYTNTYKSF